MSDPDRAFVLHVNQEIVDVILDALDVAADRLAELSIEPAVLARSIKMTKVADSIRETLHLEKKP